MAGRSASHGARVALAVSAALSVTCALSSCAVKTSATVVAIPSDTVPLVVSGEGSDGIKASFEGSELYVSAPASSGCDWSASLDNSDPADRLVEVTLVRRTAEVCGAELYEQVFKFETDVDLTDDFTVQAHVD